uniref:ER membrane protein complex subunit 6 n=1 Tax=Magallana gigas TaxID=29159 RepID=K1R9X2_MAGGI
MASGVAVKTGKKKTREASATFSEMSLRQNGSVLEYCRTSMSALSGCAAGILGLTGLQGFLFYFITAFLLSIMLLLKAGASWNKYFINRRQIFLSGLFGGLFVSFKFSFFDGLLIMITYHYSFRV